MRITTGNYLLVVIFGLVCLISTIYFDINPYRLKLDQLMDEQHRLSQLLYGSTNKIAAPAERPAKNLHYFSDLSLEAIHYVGLIKNAEKSWALISTAKRRPIYVQEGSYLGLSQARVIRFNEKELELEEAQLSEGLPVPKKRILNLKSSG